MNQDDVLPLPDRFPAHTVARFKGKENHQLISSTMDLVKEYFGKVGLPGRPIVPVAGALPFDLRRTQGELRLRLVGLVAGEMLRFEAALFRPDRSVAWSTAHLNITQQAAGAHPPPKGWIPAPAIEAMQKLEGRDLRLDKPPAKTHPHVGVVLGTLGDLKPRGANAERPVYVVTESVGDKLGIETQFEEAEDDGTVDRYYDENVEELTRLCGMHSAGDESLVCGIFAKASLEETVAFMAGRRYRIHALPA
jgi:hypothetical protein